MNYVELTSINPLNLYDDEIDFLLNQKIKITSDGNISFSASYSISGRKEKQGIKIDKEVAADLIKKINETLSKSFLVITKDPGEWHAFININHKNYSYTGELMKNNGIASINDQSLSNYMRSIIPLKGLLLFDGGR